MESKLNYKASNIAKAERAYNMKFFTVLDKFQKDSSLADFGIVDILFLWACGGGTEEEFDAAVDKDIEQAMNKIVEGIGSAGFLKTNNNKATAKTAG